jgi:hypothetical protein
MAGQHMAGPHMRGPQEGENISGQHRAGLQNLVRDFYAKYLEIKNPVTAVRCRNILAD